MSSMLSTRTLIFSLLLFSLTYFASYTIYHKSNVGKMMSRRFHTWFNTNISDYFENVRMFAQATNNKPMNCSIGKAKFSLKGMSPMKKGDDTVINFVNSKKLLTELETRKIDPGIPASHLELQHFSFSYWSFFIMPFTLLISLWIGSIPLIKIKWKALLCTFIVLIFLISLEFLSTIVRMRYNVINMEPYSISATLKTINDAVNAAIEIEFVYIATAIIFVVFNYKEFGKLIQIEKLMNS